MEKNREPRSKPTHLQSINFQQKRQEYTMEKNSLFSTLRDILDLLRVRGRSILREGEGEEQLAEGWGVYL